MAILNRPFLFYHHFYAWNAVNFAAIRSLLGLHKVGEEEKDDVIRNDYSTINQ